MAGLQGRNLGAGSAAFLMLVSATGGVRAQQSPFELPALIPNETVSIYDLPGVPDAWGCVKQCFRDDSPCDPPIFKRVDGRCRNLNTR